MRRITSIAPPVAHLVGPGRLKVVNGHLAFAVEGQPPLRLDPAALTTLLCYGDVSVSGRALELLFAQGVQAAWLTPAGNRCHGRLTRTDPPTTLTRVRQHQALARPEARLAWARLVVAGKIDALARAARHHQRHGCAAAGPVLAQLQEAAAKAPAAATLDELRGLEGSASSAWFRLLGQLLQPPWHFDGRTRRPPTDPVNALLSLGYTWLLTRTVARVEAAGCEVYLGGLHDYRPGRPSLACDLMEPLRVTAVDRWALALCQRRELTPDDFQPAENNGIHLRPAVFGSTLRSWEAHWSDNRQGEALEEWLTRFLDLLRQWSPEPPPEPTSGDGAL